MGEFSPRITLKDSLAWMRLWSPKFGTERREFGNSETGVASTFTQNALSIWYSYLLSIPEAPYKG